jgi:hypothetical protein
MQPPPRESAVESYLVAETKRRFPIVDCLKFTTPSVRGAPDRIMVLPGGITQFVELKSPKGRLSAAQRAFHERLQAQGHFVTVLRTKEHVDRYLTALEPLVNHCARYCGGAVGADNCRQSDDNLPERHQT